MKKIILLLVTILVVINGRTQILVLTDLSWNLSSDTVSLQNVDPSDVFLALQSKNVIGEPFYRDNEKKLQWVARHDWTFTTSFALTDTFLSYPEIKMIFEGLDTYAQVFLNGRQV